LLLHDVVLEIHGCYALMFVCLSGTGVPCDHTVHFSMDLVYGWIVQCSEHTDVNACPPTASHLFSVAPGREVGYECAN